MMEWLYKSLSRTTTFGGQTMWDIVKRTRGQNITKRSFSWWTPSIHNDLWLVHLVRVTGLPTWVRFQSRWGFLKRKCWQGGKAHWTVLLRDEARLLTSRKTMRRKDSRYARMILWCGTHPHTHTSEQESITPENEGQGAGHRDIELWNKWRVARLLLKMKRAAVFWTLVKTRKAGTQLEVLRLCTNFKASVPICSFRQVLKIQRLLRERQRPMANRWEPISSSPFLNKFKGVKKMTNCLFKWFKWPSVQLFIELKKSSLLTIQMNANTMSISSATWQQNWECEIKKCIRKPWLWHKYSVSICSYKWIQALKTAIIISPQQTSHYRGQWVIQKRLPFPSLGLHFFFNSGLWTRQRLRSWSILA